MSKTRFEYSKVILKNWTQMTPGSYLILGSSFHGFVSKHNPDLFWTGWRGRRRGHTSWLERKWQKESQAQLIAARQGWRIRRTGDFRL